MAEPVGLSDIPGQPWNAAYGLGLQIWNNAGARRYGHSGAMPGHWALLLVDQVAKDVVVALANSTYQGLRPEFFNGLLSLLGSALPRPQEPFRAVGLGEGEDQELLGTWYWGPVEFRLNLRSDGHLELKGARPGSRLHVPA